MLSRPRYPQELSNVVRPIVGPGACLRFCGQLLVEDRSISGCLKSYMTRQFPSELGLRQNNISQCRSLFVLII